MTNGTKVELVTNNGGTTWSKRQLARSAFVTDCAWGTSQCVGGSGYSYVWSGDAGLTWNLSAVPANLYGVYAARCASAAVCVASDGTTMLRSTNGGRVWGKVAGAGVQELACSGAGCLGTGVVHDSEALPETYTQRSTNGGLTWTKGDLPAVDPTDVACTPSLCVVVSSSGGIVTTTDLGATYVSRRADFGPYLVTCGDTEHCLAPDTAGGPQFASGLGLSSDGGRTWRHIQLFDTGYPDSYYDVACASGLVCFALGTVQGIDFEYIAGTTDGGATWDGDGYDYPIGGGTAITCMSVTRCVAIGNGPAQIWIQGSGWADAGTSSPDGSALSCSGMTCYANSSAGTKIWKSIDGGVTWNPAGSAPATRTNALYCSTAMRCMAAGVTMQRTTNGGLTWSNVATPATGEFRDVTCAVGRCLAVTWTSAVASDDAGASWHRAALPTSGGGGSVACTTAFCLIASPAMLRTP